MISEDKTTGFLKIQLISIVWNILLIFAAYFICGLLFYFENSGSYTNALNLSLMFQGWWRFTLSATLYTNILLAVIYLIPLHYKYCKFADVLGRILFVTVNSIAIIVNLMDAVYFKYTGRRTDASVFKEFGNEDNIGGIIGHELLMHWYFVIAGILLFYALYKLYLSPLKSKYKPSSLPIYYALQTIVLGALGFGIVCGMRGGIGRQVRPIAVGNANQYVNKPIETALVLNTPFCLIRTVGKNAYKNPQYFSDSEAEQIFCPIRQKNDADTTALKKMNVVVLIVESFAKEHIGALNKELEDGRYEGYTPFVDSLVNESLTFKYSYANGRKSIGTCRRTEIHRLQNGLLPRSIERLYGLRGFCQGYRIQRILRQNGIRQRPKSQGREGIRRQLGHLGRTFHAVLLRRDEPFQAAFHDRHLHRFVASSVQHSGEVQKNFS